MKYYYLYIIQNVKGDLYIGQTADLQERVKRHAKGDGAKYTADHKSFKLVYSENFPSRAAAMKRETQLKKWSRAKKDALISGDLKKLKKL